jgi:hypothetical protein
MGAPAGGAAGGLAAGATGTVGAAAGVTGVAAGGLAAAVAADPAAAEDPVSTGLCCAPEDSCLSSGAHAAQINNEVTMVDVMYLRMASSSSPELLAVGC